MWYTITVQKKVEMEIIVAACFQIHRQNTNIYNTQNNTIRLHIWYVSRFCLKNAYLNSSCHGESFVLLYVPVPIRTYQGNLNQKHDILISVQSYSFGAYYGFVVVSFCEIGVPVELRWNGCWVVVILGLFLDNFTYIHTDGHR